MFNTGIWCTDWIKLNHQTCVLIFLVHIVVLFTFQFLNKKTTILLVSGGEDV